MLWEEYISDMIHFAKRAWHNSERCFVSVFFCFCLRGGGFLFFFKQNLSLSREASLVQTSIFGQNRIYALSRIFDLNRSYALRRILFGHISFWKNIVPEFKTWFLFRFFLFFQTRPVFGQRSIFWSVEFMLWVEFLIWIGIMLWEEYISDMFHFAKKAWQNSERCFVSVLFFCLGGAFFFSNKAWTEKHLWVRQVILVRAEFMLWVEFWSV